MTNALTVWVGGRRIGSLAAARSGLRFTYDADELARVGLDRPVVSMSLPTSVRSYANRSSLPFFDGLLPEGEARRIISYDLGVAEPDTFELLRALGRDCAGALSIIGESEAPPEPAPINTLLPLDPSALDRRIAGLRFQPLGVDGRVRVSLGGVQEKLLLSLRTDGSWGLPTSEVASTHIVKPAIVGLDGCVANEAVCLRFAALVGVRAATATTTSFDEREALVVERFDRRVGADGVVRRIHQETACQALAVPVASVTRKYEDAGGPNLRTVASLLWRWSTADNVEELLRQVTVNVLVGNADAHAMNTSFTIDESGVVNISPMYDVFSTLAYPQLSTTPGMFVDGVRDIRQIGRRELVNEASSWGLDSTRAYEIVESVLDAATAAMRASLAEFDAPKQLAAHLRNRVRSFI